MLTKARKRCKIPDVLKRKYHVCQAGIRHNYRCRMFKPSLLSKLMANVRSPANKLDELGALMKTQQ